ncbi:MAG: protoheme IX farnesyltransferase, partial [Pikeienuella sp.]
MTDATTDIVRAAPQSVYEPRFEDYVALLKPRVMRLVVFTALAAMAAAPGEVPPLVAIAALDCIALGARASGAVHMWWGGD